MDARLETLYRMQPLSAAETDALFTEVFAGSMSEPELASLLTALKMKGETPDEIRGAAAAMLRAARPFPKSAFEVGEIVGTGGDGAGTINVSPRRAQVSGSPSTATAACRPRRAPPTFWPRSASTSPTRPRTGSACSRGPALPSASRRATTPQCALRLPSGRRSAPAQFSTSSAPSRTPPIPTMRSSASTIRRFS